MDVLSLRICLPIALAWVLASPALHAGKKPPPPPPPADPCLSDERCASLYEEGLDQSKAGKFAEALSSYQQAYDRRPVPWLLINIGRMQQKMGQPKEAIATYQLFLESPAAQREPELAMTARQYVKQAELEDRNKKMAMDLASSNQELEKLKKPPLYKRPWFWLSIVGATATVVSIGVGVWYYNDHRTANAGPLSF